MFTSLNGQTFGLSSPKLVVIFLMVTNTGRLDLPKTFKMPLDQSTRHTYGLEHVVPHAP